MDDLLKRMMEQGFEVHFRTGLYHAYECVATWNNGKMEKGYEFKASAESPAEALALVYSQSRRIVAS